MRGQYGFPFWRLSYLFDIFEDDREVAFGLGLQIRNANLELATSDGELLRSARDVGPVPLLKFRGRAYLRGRFWMGAELDGFYAPIRCINGGHSDVDGLDRIVATVIDRGADAVGAHRPHCAGISHWPPSGVSIHVEPIRASSHRCA